MVQHLTKALSSCLKRVEYTIVPYASKPIVSSPTPYTGDEIFQRDAFQILHHDESLASLVVVKLIARPQSSS